MREEPLEGPILPKKPIKVYLSREEVEMLDHVCRRIGEDHSTFIRSILLNHLKDLNLIKERVHAGT